VLRELLPTEPAWLAQVHGRNVVDLDRLANGENPYPVAHLQMGEKPVSGITPPVAQADASVSHEPNRICLIQSADCLPVLFASTDGNCVAAAHGGWRGLAAGVLEATVKSMNVGSDKILAYFCPAISQSAFEVGPEVRDALLAAEPNAEYALKDGEQGKWLADLYVFARLRLASVGVTRVYGGNYCTFKDNKRFFSYRRDRSCGRFASMVWME
jgi:polyphenol oxidase